LTYELRIDYYGKSFDHITSIVKKRCGQKLLVLVRYAPLLKRR